MNTQLLALLSGLAFSSAALAISVAQEARQLIANGDAGIALVQLDTYLANNPKDPEARFARGMALSRLNRGNEAKKAFSELIRDVPQYPEPYNNLGVLLAGAGEYAKARTAFEAAIVKNPGYTSAQLNLGEIEVALAIQAYQAVLNTEPGNTMAQAKLALLKSLQTTAPSAQGSAVSANTRPPAQRPQPLPLEPAEPAAALTGRVEPPGTGLQAPPLSSPVAINQNAGSAAAADSPGGIALAPAVSAPASAATRTAELELAPASSDENSEPRRAVLDVVKVWANAWSKQDADRFVSLYARDFIPPDSASRSRWLEARRQNILAPKQIRLRLDALQFTMLNEQRARVSFRQNYESDLGSETINKTLVLQNIAGAWLIVHEQNG